MFQVHTDNAATNTVTLTLPNPGPNCKHCIKWVAIYAAGATPSILDIEITKADATTIVRVGGPVAAGSVPAYFYYFGGSGANDNEGVIGYTADTTKVILTATTATSCRVTAGVKTIPA